MQKVSLVFILGVKFTELFLTVLKTLCVVIVHCQIRISASLTWNEVNSVEQKTGWFWLVGLGI